MGYLDEVKEKKLQKASQQGRDQFAQAFKGFADNLQALTDSLSVSQMQKLDKEMVVAISNLSDIAKEMKSIKVMGDDDIKTALKTIAVLLKANKPVINLPEINIDTKPIEKTLQNHFDKMDKKEVKEFVLPEVVGLDDYRAQDIDEAEIGVQFVGFVNPKGEWYIIRNDVEKNQLRYKFGSGDYEECFRSAPSYEYKILSEAYDEAKTQSPNK